MAASSTSVDRSRSVYAFQEITDSVIRKLEDGGPPWLRPRQRPGSLSGFPPSLIVRRTVSTVTVGRDFETGFHDLFAATGLGFGHGAIRTFYSPSRDTIILSDWRCHPDVADFYREWIHELVHATGHRSRLGRDLPPACGSRIDAFEDLIAEIGSAQVCAALGIAPALRHPEAIAAWIALLRADCHAWRRAVRFAKQSANYLFALRDAQAAAFDRLDADEAAVRARARLEDQAGRSRRRLERERWAFGSATGSRPGERLPATRSGDLS